jgi:hypothetical protein
MLVAFTLAFVFTACGEASAPLSPSASTASSTLRPVEASIEDVGASGVICHVTAAGTLAPNVSLPGGDRFAGSVMDLGDRVVGHWTHLTPDGRQFVGTPEELDCAQNGALLVTVIGHGRFDGLSELPFAFVFQDREDPEQVDFYLIRVVSADGDLLYEAEGDLASGDVRTRR